MSAAKHAGYVVKIVEQEGQKGDPPRSISFVDVNFKALGYRQLDEARLHQPIDVPLEWDGAKVVETDIEGLNVGQSGRCSTILNSRFSSTTVSLQRGGWLPSCLAVMHGVTILPDRNVLTQIKARFDQGALVKKRCDFLDLLENFEGRINPLLFAIEGNCRSIPTREAVEEQLDEAIRLISKALPKAKLVVGPDTLQGALGLIEDTRAGLGRKQAFLLEIAPALDPPTSRALLDTKWREVLKAADRHGVARNTLVVLAALSTVTVPNSGSPAKKVLKFHSRYSAEDAYNALADLRSLEILMHIYALFPSERAALFTADKPLALFWTAIQADNFKNSSAGISFNLAPVEELLPSQVIERWQRDILV